MIGGAPGFAMNVLMMAHGGLLPRRNSARFMVYFVEIP